MTHSREIEAFSEHAASWLGQNFERRPSDGADWADRIRPQTSSEMSRVVSVARKKQVTLHDAGFAGIAWPIAYGGQGLTHDHEMAFREVSEPFDLLELYILRVGLHHCGPTLLALGSEELKHQHIRQMIHGDTIWCQLFSEPDAGSDIANIRTAANRIGNGWVLNGQKIWTSVAAHADYGLIVARSEPGSSRHRGLSMFVVDMRASGVDVRPITQMTGGSQTFAEVFFSDVVVPADQVVGKPGEGWHAAMTMLNAERRSLGSRRDIPDITAALTRLARSANVRDSQLRQRIAEVIVLARVTTHLTRRAAHMQQTRNPLQADSSLIKLRTGAASRLAAVTATQILGADAIAWRPTTMDREAAAWRAALLQSPVSSIAGGTDQIQLNVIAERGLGLPK